MWRVDHFLSGTLEFQLCRGLFIGHQREWVSRPSDVRAESTDVDKCLAVENDIAANQPFARGQLFLLAAPIYNRKITG